MGKKNERTLPGITMWTCIAIRLTHLIFQYSGEPDACSLNTQEQNNHILKNFDINGTFGRSGLSVGPLWFVYLEFRSVFCETSVTLYKKMITMIQDKIKPMVVSSMLDHDSLHGNTSGKSIEVSCYNRKLPVNRTFAFQSVLCFTSITSFFINHKIGHYDHSIEFVNGV